MVKLILLIQTEYGGYLLTMILAFFWMIVILLFFFPWRIPRIPKYNYHKQINDNQTYNSHCGYYYLGYQGFVLQEKHI